MSEMKKKLAVNTSILTCTSVMIRLIGMGFNAWLSGRIGPEGVGLFQLIMSVYSLAVMLAVSGMRMAATRLASEAIALGDGTRGVMSACLRVSGGMGLAAMALLFVLADFASGLLGNAETAYPLRVLSLALPFVAMSTSLGGYFTARRRMGVYGVVQMVEQGCRVGLTALILRAFPPDDEHAILAVAAGIVAAEAVSFLCSFSLCLIDMRAERTGRAGGVYARIGRIAVPEAMGSWLRSSLSTAEQILIPRQLEKASPGGGALAVYGTIQGMAMPVISLPSAPMTAMAGMLVPEIAQMRVRGETKRIRRAVVRALKWTILYSCAVAAALLIAADWLADAIYHHPPAAAYIRALALLIPLLYTDSVTDHLLKSLDQQMHCMRLNTIDCMLRLAVVLLFMPGGGTAVYIALIYLSEAFNFIFSLKKLLQITSPAHSKAPADAPRTPMEAYDPYRVKLQCPGSRRRRLSFHRGWQR